MQLRLFPVRADKTPVFQGWQQAATTDQETLNLWANLHRNEMKWWGIPTGNGLIVLDVDAKDNGLETLKSLNLPKTMSQRTQNGGFHFFFKYHVNGHRYGNRVKFKPGLDIRAEGGYVVFYGADQTPIADAPQWLLDEACQKSYDHTGPTVRVETGIAQGIIQKSIETIKQAPQGERNNTLNTEAFKIGQLVSSESITKDYAQNVLLRAAVECGLDVNESKSTISSALYGGSKKPLTTNFGAPQATAWMPAPPGLPVSWAPEKFTKTEIMDMSKLRSPQLFKDWSTEDIHLLVADGGTGKTTLVLFEAICLALGERFLGCECLQSGKTIFITGEDTRAKLGSRIGAICQAMKLSDEKIQLVLDSVVVKKDNDLCVITKDRLNLLHPNRYALDRILEVVEAFKPKMIVFDPIDSFWGSEAGLNDMARAVSKFMGEIAHKGICVQMINHMGKASSSAKDMTQFAGRGGSGLPSHARVSKNLVSLNEEQYEQMTHEKLDDKQTAMLCVVNKFTDGSSLYNKPFIILRDGYLFSAKSLSKATEIELQNTMSETERIFTFIKEERRCNRYPTKAVVVAHFVNCGDPIPQTRINQALAMLDYTGHLGEKIKSVANPDATVKDKVFIITDEEGRES